SIGDVFMAGIIPGILTGVAVMIYAYIYCRRNPIPEVPEELKPLPILKSLRGGFWALLSPFIILGGIYGGIFTPTEAASVSFIYAVIVGKFIYKELSFKDMPKYIYNAAAITAPLLIIISLSSVFGRILTFEGIPALVANAMLGLSTNPIILLILVNILMLTIGTFIDTLSKVIILTPILLPIAVTVGVDPVHFGMIMIVNFAIGLVTPPTGISLFVASAITKTPFLTIARASLGPLAALLIVLILIMFVPALSLFLV
ncbi:MAG: TRAP transporter large permease, partial [Defluviitaleaceae bacterium]|nr:TRAP transporter large permease [Defluviitaleaceae bacterium]